MDNTGPAQVGEWIGKNAIDADGEKIGKIKDIYLDDDTGRPEWLAITTGLFGTKVSFAPLSGASERDDEVVLPYTKAQVKDAPRCEADGHLSPDEEQSLYSHYGLTYAGMTSRADETGDLSARRASTEGMTTGGMASAARGERFEAEDIDDRFEYEDIEGSGRFEGSDRFEGSERFDESGDDAMTRSEETLDVDTQRREAGRARLRKWVDTERVETTVPVTHEEARVEREPIDSDNIDEALGGPEISESVHEVTLHEDEAVVNKNVEPKERVRLEKDVVTEEETVGADVRKERIEAEGDVSRGTRRP